MEQVIHDFHHTRVAQLVANVTAVMPGGIKDWPSNIQDRIYKALETINEKNKAQFTIVDSYSDNDIDDGPFVHVIAVYRVKLPTIVQ